jgi:microcin C transport system ATP-binding protein
MSLLEIENLNVSFGRGQAEVKAAREVSLTIEKGETHALVGESGSGKSVSALSVMRLLPYPLAWHPTAQNKKSAIRFAGEDLMTASEGRIRTLRGDRIAMIFQEPLTSLNPLQSIERQISEVLFLHKSMNARQAHDRAVELLHLVGLSEATERLQALPHEFSGGQQQRVMIAMALANEPDLLIADEPTTAVDVTIQAQILKLLRDLQKRFSMALLLITHDLGIVKRMADNVSVMTEGRIVEQGPVEALFKNPQHPYTRRLLASEPKGRPERVQSEKGEEIISADDLKVWFPIKKGIVRRTVGHVKAVDGLSFSLRQGRTLGVVGESGSGKSSLGRALLRLEKSTGNIAFHGSDISKETAAALRPLRRRMQIVFQDPFGSLSPRLSVEQIVGEGLGVHNLGGDYEERRKLIAKILEEVGLDAEMMERYPHEFSGGQRQRISIARALVLEPDFIVLDEPTSALDVSVQAQIVDLLRDIQKRRNLAYLFISHDLKVVRALAHDVMVIRQGKIVEQGPADDIFERPKMPYTKALLAAAFEMKADETGAVSR